MEVITPPITAMAMGERNSEPIPPPTAVGTIPIAIGFGAADPSFRSPMAIAVIGGLITSTALSLLVVPVVFEVVDDTERVAGKWRLRLRETVRRRRRAA